MQPYLLNESVAYEAWREQKLNNYPQVAEELIIELNNPIKLMDNELDSLKSICAKANIVIYRCSDSQQENKQIVISLAEQLGLNQFDANLCADEDKISVIQDKGPNQASYIPYTNKPLNWHTDGYYNSAQQRIRAFSMHCVRPAVRGGENSYLDPEIAYVLLRDENPNYIEALMGPSVMTIPANEENGRQIRATQSGPVFFIDQTSQSLQMRYTARKRNIIWKNDKTVEQALSFLHEILQGNPYLFRYRLNAGEGVICNNVLHNRSAFEDKFGDDGKRLLYRARFYNRVANHNKGQALQDVVNQ